MWGKGDGNNVVTCNCTEAKSDDRIGVYVPRDRLCILLFYIKLLPL